LNVVLCVAQTVDGRLDAPVIIDCHVFTPSGN